MGGILISQKIHTPCNIESKHPLRLDISFSNLSNIAAVQWLGSTIKCGQTLDAFCFQVRMSAFQALGGFISTFADPDVIEESVAKDGSGEPGNQDAKKPTRYTRRFC